MPSRRELLHSMTVLGVTGALAGCQDGGGPAETDTDTPTETTTTTAPGDDETQTEAATVQVQTHDEYGDILVDSEGMTLYLFTPDGENESVCTDDCAEAWPPLTVEDEPRAGENLEAPLETFERPDGSMQVAIDGVPLYYFQRDEAPGDTTGQGVNDAWYVLGPDGSGIMPTVMIQEHDEYGNILVDSEGMTLYLFTPDSENESVCTDDCAEAWPPLTVEGDPLAGSDLEAPLETFERPDGSMQVAIDGVPLYYFQRDEEPGDTTGQGVNDVWFVLGPDGSAIKPTVMVRNHETYGDILVDSEGMTLYLFTPDGENETACTDDCAALWPPLTVEGEPTASGGLEAPLGTFERPDGSMQVAIDGVPLYLFQRDEEPGDATGQGLNDAWYVLAPDGSMINTMATETQTETPTSTMGSNTGSSGSRY
jgi:predicted lipoprotein with Yx(FWY)xxD motif